MPDKKKQHYVPKLYLKKFCDSENSNTIGLYNFKSNKIITTTDFKNQAYKTYFYGKDGFVEEMLGRIEQEIEPILKKIIQDCSLQINKDYIELLRLHTLLQSIRTNQVLEEVNFISEKIKKLYCGDDEEKLEMINKDEVENKINGSYMISLMGSKLDVIDDLGYKLIVNNTKFQLITSDHPVVFYNQFLENREYKYAKLGLRSKGLQIFFPISPYLMIHFFDNKVYNLGRKNSNKIDLTINSVNKLNLLQILNCGETLFFHPRTQSKYLFGLIQKANSHRFDRSFFEKEIVLNPNQSIHYHLNDRISINLKLDFVKFTKNALNYKFGDYFVELRN